MTNELNVGESTLTLDGEALKLALTQLSILCNDRADANCWNIDFPQRDHFVDGAVGDHAYASAVGNWDAVKVSLFASEAFEAQDELRKGRTPDEVYYPTSASNKAADERGEHKPEGVPSELADILIRVFHYAGFRGIDLGEAVMGKLEFNGTRGYRHGAKAF